MLIFFWLNGGGAPPPEVAVGKPDTAYSMVGKPDTSFVMPGKSDTPYALRAKPDTSYSTNPDISNGVTLDSATVTLNSLLVYLQGYTTATPPSDNQKANAAYSSVTKPDTPYSRKDY